MQLSIICKQCGKDAPKYVNYQYNRQKIFCSKECYSVWLRKNPKIGEENRNWKGNDAGYGSIHDWIKRSFGKANKCESDSCSKISNKFEWANISGEYKRDRNDFHMLCKSCHTKYDNMRLLGNFCQRGHELISDNIYYRKDGRRRCRLCRNIKAKILQRKKRENYV